MSTLSNRLVFSVLAALVVITRPYHLAELHHLPDASLACFFLVGALLNGRLFFVAMLGVALGIDALVMLERGGLLACVSPSYGMLPLAYGVLFQVGATLRQRGLFTHRRAAVVMAALVAATSLAFVMTSGAYHFFSGHVAEPTLATFASRASRYAFGYLTAPLLYVVVALGLCARYPLATESTRHEA